MKDFCRFCHFSFIFTVYSEFFWLNLKRFSEFDFTAKFWVFLKSVKIKVLFVSAWLLTKSCFWTLPIKGEDTKTLTIFSSLTKILWSFFHKTASQGLFRCILPLTRTLPQPPRHAPVNAKRRQDFSCRQAFPAITVPGNRKASAVRSSLPECFS